jgi:DNA polymerase V
MNKAYAPVDIPEDADLELFGVVTNVVHSLRQP